MKVVLFCPQNVEQVCLDGFYLIVVIYGLFKGYLSSDMVWGTLCSDSLKHLIMMKRVLHGKMSLLSIIASCSGLKESLTSGKIIATLNQFGILWL